MSAQNQEPWVKYMAPTFMHALLSDYSGNFTMEITMSAGEGKEPMSVKVISDHLTLGYNNIDDQFAPTTLTNIGTGNLSLFGKYDEKSKSATLFGHLTNPVTRKVIKVKQVVTSIDPDYILIESYDQEEGTSEKKTVV